MQPRSSIVPALLIVAGLPASLAAQETEPAFTPPTYQFQRWQEDWSGLRDRPAGPGADWCDGIKFISLSEDESVWLSLGGHARLRAENWSNFAFGAPANDDDTFALWRIAVHGDLHFGENVRVFVEGKSAMSFERDLPGGRRTLDDDSIDLEQAFLDLDFDLGSDTDLTVRGGRQVYAFGKQRLVSPLPWANTLRRWDGVSGILKCRDWTVTGFWSQFAPVRKFDFNQADAQTQFFGAYATGTIGGTTVGADVYFLGLDRDDPVTFNGTTGTEERFTFGGRVFGKLGDTRFDYDAEGAYQFGEVGAGDVEAYMFGGQIGFTPGGSWARTRLFVGLDYATGDDEPGGDVETFNQLFPLGHAYYGYIDIVGRQNAIDLNAGFTCNPWERTTFGASGHFLWRDSDRDALYNAGGGVVRAGGLGTSSELGIEVDLTLKHSFDRHLAGLFGYSHFFAGDFIEESGASDDIGFAYAQLQYTF